MGASFADVAIREGGAGDGTAESVGAIAFTRGSDVHFRSGAFQPGTREGDHLIAHELAHVMQDGGGSAIRRKLVVDGKAWKYADVDDFVTRERQKYKDKDKGRAPTEVGAEAVERMGSIPGQTFTFPNERALEREMVMRQVTVASLNDPETCAYSGDGHKPKLNPKYWQNGTSNGWDWHVIKGVKPSAAIRSIFEGEESEWRLECYTMTLASVYKGQLEALGDAQFDKHYAGGLSLSTRADSPVAQGVLQVVPAATEKELVPGDWVYFKNHPDYLKKHPGGYWQGENTLCVGRNAQNEVVFRGFGIPDGTTEQVKKALVKAFNKRSHDDSVPKDLRDKKITIADVPGPILDGVKRPTSKALEDV